MISDGSGNNQKGSSHQNKNLKYSPRGTYAAAIFCPPCSQSSNPTPKHAHGKCHERMEIEAHDVEYMLSRAKIQSNAVYCPDAEVKIIADAIESCKIVHIISHNGPGDDGQLLECCTGQFLESKNVPKCSCTLIYGSFCLSSNLIRELVKKGCTAGIAWDSAVGDRTASLSSKEFYDLCLFEKGGLTVGEAWTIVNNRNKNDGVYKIFGKTDTKLT